MVHKKVALPFKEPILSGFTVVECKKGVARLKDANQLSTYMEWMAMKKARGYHKMIRGVIVAAGFERSMSKLSRAKERIQLVKYEAGKHEQITLTKIEDV